MSETPESPLGRAREVTWKDGGGVIAPVRVGTTEDEEDVSVRRGGTGGVIEVGDSDRT